MESAAYFSVTSAGYAGRFRIAFGRWPASVDELDEFMCMTGQADRYELTRRTCDDVVSWPYRTVLTPEGKHLRIRYFDRSSSELVCNLQVQAPPAGARADTFPKIIINTTVFTCAGPGWEAGAANIERHR